MILIGNTLKAKETRPEDFSFVEANLVHLAVRWFKVFAASFIKIEQQIRPKNRLRKSELTFCK